MAEFTEQDAIKLSEAHDAIIKIKTVLLGANGDKGLVGKVDDVCERQETSDNRLNNLHKHFWILIGILIGSGVISLTGWGIVELTQGG